MPTVPLPVTSREYTTSDEPCKFSDRELWDWYCRFVTAFMDCPNWNCPECGTVNFGRNKFCPYCRQRKGKETLRPAGTGVEEKWKRMGNI